MSQNYNFLSEGWTFLGAFPQTPLAVYALCAGSTENCLLWACYRGISLTCLLCLKILFTPLPLPSSALSLTGECCVKPTVPVYNACDRRTARWGRWIECYTWMECYTHHIIMQPLSLCLAYGNWLALHSWNHINAFFHICDYMNETYIW